jgi:hypothetical protein
MTAVTAGMLKILFDTKTPKLYASIASATELEKLSTLAKP